MKFFVFIVLIMGTAFLVLLSGFTLPTLIALLVFVLAITSDFYTTWRCLKARGREGNPVMALLFRKVGIRKTFCMMAGLWVCVIMFRWLPSPEGAQTAVALAYWIVPMNNLTVLAKLKRRKVVC